LKVGSVMVDSWAGAKARFLLWLISAG